MSKVIQILVLEGKLVALHDDGEVRVYTNAQQLERTYSVLVEAVLEKK